MILKSYMTAIRKSKVETRASSERRKFVLIRKGSSHGKAYWCQERKKQIILSKYAGFFQKI